MSTFPSLKPAFTALLDIDPGLPVGTLSSGSNLVWVKITSGSIKSEPDYPVAINAELVSGADWIHVDPSGETCRLDVRSIFKTDDGALLNFSYLGVIYMDEGISKIFSGAEDMKSTAFGGAVTHKFIQTGEAKYKKLEDGIFVSVGRFIVDGKKVSVEYKVSQVVV